MQRVAAVTVAVAVLFAGTQLSAQERPSFAGTWTMEAAAGGPMGGGGARGGGAGGRGGGRMGGMGMMAGLGQQATITQDANTLTVVRSTPAGEIRSVYNLDGSESRNTLTAGGGEVEQLSRASWDGSKLVIVTSVNFGGNAVETTMSLSLDEAGKLLVESAGGFGGRGGGGPTTITYTKG